MPRLGVLGMMPVHGPRGRLPELLHIVDVRDVGFDVFAARRDVVRLEILARHSAMEMLVQSLPDGFVQEL
jgi:hypothetical protein